MGYHYIPVAEAFTWLLWRLSGLHVTRYQVLNLAELVLVAWALYLFGTALLRRPWISFMASLLLIASPAIHEVTHWAVIGNFHLLAGLFYLAGLGVALRMGRDETRRGPVWLGWLFALFLCLAVLTYEATITMLPVGFALWLVARPSRAMAEGMGWSPDTGCVGAFRARPGARRLGAGSFRPRGAGFDELGDRLGPPGLRGAGPVGHALAARR